MNPEGNDVMFCMKARLVPTSALTFRILPGSIVHIATYPFVPPTTLSGYLRRLDSLSKGTLPPTTAGHSGKKAPPYWVLPPEFICCGAYPEWGEWTVHRTARLGPESLSHTLAGRLRSEKDKQNPQLHTWEYLVVTELTAYVVHEDADALKSLAKTVNNVGCKLGKEGFAYVAKTSVVKLERAHTRAVPSTIAPAKDLLDSPADVYPLYAYDWDRKKTFDFESPSPVNGFRPFTAGWTDGGVKTDYWSGDGVNIPASLLEVLA